MATHAELQEAPAAEALNRLAERLAPGARVTRLRRLKGGISAGMHALTLERATVEAPARERAAVDALDLAAPRGPLRVVLRRLATYEHRDPVDAQARQSYAVLELLQRLDLPAPRPLLLDDTGELFGVPAFVMTREPGRPLLRPHDREDWLRQLAGALARVHRASLAGMDTSMLDDLAWIWRPLDAPGERWLAARDAPEVLEALRRWRPRLRPVRPALLHTDYWAGNTLWVRDRLCALVDWGGAALGPPGFDVGYTRTDLAIMIGGDAPDRFLYHYEAAAGRRIPQLFVWDLVGAARALPNLAQWLPGWQDYIRSELTVATLEERLHMFVLDALRRA